MKFIPVIKKTTCLFCTAVLLFSCSPDGFDRPENPLFSILAREQTGIHFSNDVRETQDFNLFNYRNFYNGGGVALGDINNDERVDIYFTSNQGVNRLYLNEGDFHFKDITETAGVAGSMPWSTGVTMADVNADGLLDIYVLNSADMNGGNRKNELFINQGDLTFNEEAEKFNLDDNAFSVHASFFDYDSDGDLDCYLVNNSFKGTATNMQKLLRQSREQPDELGGDKLLRNDDGVFTDVSRQAGIYQGEIGFGLGVIAGDINEDHLTDIYVSNDFWEKDYLYINNGDGTFSEELNSRTSHVSQSSMGSDIGDINNDGRLDIFTTDMLPTDAGRIKTMTVFDNYRFDDRGFHDRFHYQYVQNTLQVNNGNGTFSELGFLSGVAATDWSWGALMFDFSNDGRDDLFVSNGIYRDITDKDFHNFISDKRNIAKIVREKGEFNILDFLERLPSQKIKNAAFTNNGDKTFTHRSDSLGFYEPTFSNGAAYGDLDNDGDLDLVVNNLNSEASLYRNDADRYFDHHFLKVKFEGDSLNRFGIGAHVKLFAGGEQQAAEHIPSRSFQSSVPMELHFGLGDRTVVDSLMVVWPDRRMQVLRNIKVDQTIRLKKESADRRRAPENGPKVDPLIADATGSRISGDIKHIENRYIDFNRQPLLPHMLSTEGPALAKGDVNGDGLEDFFVTGSVNNQDKLFVQQSNGMFSPLVSPIFILEIAYESSAAALLDLDGDEDLDLMVANGGNQYDIESNHYRVRAYRNNGNGRFTKAPELSPNVHLDASVMKAEDFDSDGDKDLFLGARVTPRNYGVDPRSYLLENRGNGKWNDVTPEELKRAGMITDAVWADYDGDGDSDLVVVGEWMPVMMFNNNDGKLEFESSPEQSNGWWTAIRQVDLDGDGDTDFVLGNWGLNSKFRATPDRPITMYVNDFNGDRKSEFIINTYQPGDETPYLFHTYEDLIRAMPFLEERITNHHQYAGLTYEDLFTGQERDGAVKKEIHTLQSSLLVNHDGEFEMQKLPVEAQVSPVYSIVAKDFNRDEKTDLLLLGNLHGVKPEVGRLDANYGVFLFNRGENGFRFIPYHRTGTFIRGEVRDAALVDIGGEEHIIITLNDEELKLFR